MSAPGDHRAPGRRGIPAEIGPYQIQRVLGSGGMATVYAALQKQPRRTVAVKVMRRGVETTVATRRFRREIEILGRLRHPFIAQVYGAGVHDDGEGQVPYLVMEYVPRAKTIIEYANACELSQRERLKLFVKICAAVEHGHRRRILHRDLKPGNILVDEGGEPKVIDFGVSRVIDPNLSEQTVHTEAGRLIGTIQYMAPEQLDTSHPDLTPACDVYALGVLLFRLLTGVPPHDLKGMPVFTAAQVIREDPPARPSRINAELKGDLETILLKSLAKDPRRRYPSAGSLGRDLLRYLANKPVHARDAGALYRFALFARRHPIELGAATVALLAVAVAVVVIVLRPGAAPIDRTQAPVPVAPAPAPAPAGARDPSATAPPPTVVPQAPAGDATHASAPRAFTLRGLGSAITALAFAPDASVLTAADVGHRVMAWSLADRRPVVDTSAHDATIRDILFSDDGTTIVTVDALGNVVLIERRTGETFGLPIPRGRVLSAALSADGSHLAVGWDALSVTLYRQNGEEVDTVRPGKGAFTALAFSPDGHRLAGGSIRGAVEVFDLAGETPKQAYRDPREEAVTAVAFGPDGTVAALAASGRVLLWRPGSGIAPHEIDAPPGTLAAAAIDRTGRWLARLAGGNVRLLDLTTREAYGAPIELAPDLAVERIAVSPDGRWCAIGDAAGNVRIEPIPVGEGG
jgi:hypothetical protein